MSDQARVLLAELTECISARGTTYLRGWLGASNVLGFAGEPDAEGRPVWRLFLVERQPKPANSTSPRPQGGGLHRDGDRVHVRRQSARARRDQAADDALQRHGCGDRPFDDPLPF